MLQRQFRGLHRRFLSELKERRVSVDDVLTELTLLPIECRKEYESLIQQKLPMLEESTRITTLFNRLNPLFTFIDYGLLQHLISNLGSTELNEDMTSYVDVVQEFMRETTVGDVINHWPGDEESHASFSKLRAKFKDDPKTYTLERLNNFRRTFCCHVRLSEFIFGLKSLEPSESFFVTWLFPTVVVTQLSKLVRQVEHSFYESEHILSISVDQKQLYPPPVSAATGIASPTPVLSVSARGSKRKRPEVLQAGDLITPTIAPEHAITKKDVQPKSTDNTLDIIAIGWKGATRFAELIIGPNKGRNLNLWDYTDREYYPQESDDREEFTEKIKEELQARISKCQHPNLVLVFNYPYCGASSLEEHLGLIIGLSVSDLTRFLGHSIWNNAVVVQPFLDFYLTLLEYQEYLKSEFIKHEYEWRDIDREVVANVPVIPVNSNPRSPELPDRIDWLSPFWDTCLQRMTESAQYTFLKANADRIKLATGGETRKDNYEPLHKQAIIYVPGPNTSKAPVHSAVSNLLGTEIAGPFGTTPVQLHRQPDSGTTPVQLHRQPDSGTIPVQLHRQPDSGTTPVQLHRQPDPGTTPVQLHFQPDPVEKKKDKCTLS